MSIGFGLKDTDAILGFRTQANLDENSIRDRVAGLLGCGNAGANTINGLSVATIDGSGVCLSNGDGCGDCFDGAL